MSTTTNYNTYTGNEESNWIFGEEGVPNLIGGFGGDDWLSGGQEDDLIFGGAFKYKSTLPGDKPRPTEPEEATPEDAAPASDNPSPQNLADETSADTVGESNLRVF
jgi:Ca2+-binding RTX toxin-like protein